jgi:hypothetical protein
MKNFVKIFGIIALVAVIGFTMVACGGGGKIPNGKYVASGGKYYEFSGKNVTVWFHENYQTKGTYTIDKDGLFVYTEEDGTVQKLLFALDKKELLLGSTTYTKQ